MHDIWEVKPILETTVQHREYGGKLNKTLNDEVDVSWDNDVLSGQREDDGLKIRKSGQNFCTYHIPVVYKYNTLSL